jgi:hypothetical protein
VAKEGIEGSEGEKWIPEGRRGLRRKGDKGEK